MPTAHLDDRALLSVGGPDAEAFLQNILTVDLDALPAGEARPGALLTPQGKILFDFLVSRSADGFLLECRADIADDFQRRLMMYRLRAKVEFSKRVQPLVEIWWRDDSGNGDDAEVPVGSLIDTRFAEGSVARSYNATHISSASFDAWHAFRIASGVAESGSDYALGDAFPHDVLLDQNGGVGFRKGCYVGQEVVSRIQHRGTARRRVLIASSAHALPPQGTAIIAAGRPLGSMGSSHGGSGLALVRIDKVKMAMDAGLPITADGVAISLIIPAFAKFGFPEDAAPAEEA